MQRITHREYLCWVVRRQQEWDTPSRSDYYLMRIAYEVSCILKKGKPKLDLNKFKIKFSFSKQNTDSAQHMSFIESIWKRRIGKK